MKEMKIGYARVSTTDQNLDLQINALKKEGCELIYKEKKSAVVLRPELERMMENLSEGDIVVVWRIDRLARSLSHLISLIEEMKSRKIKFISLQDNINTNSIMGEFFLHISGAFAQLERSLNSERTKAGLQAAKERGTILGRKKGLSANRIKIADEAVRLYTQNLLTVKEICSSLNISTATLYRYLTINDISLKSKA